MKKTRKELKDQVKQAYSGRWGQMIGLHLIPFVASMALTGMITGFFGWFTPQPLFDFLTSTEEIPTEQFNQLMTHYWPIFVLFILIEIILSILQTHFTIGPLYALLDLLKDPKNADFDWLTAGFSSFQKPTFKSNTLLIIVSNIFIFLWSLLLIIPGIIKTFSYSQIYYFNRDFYEHTGKNMGTLDMITTSRRLMVGNKWRYFVLSLSFIPWVLLSMLTLGIGFLWLIPYMNGTMTAFYLDLVKDENFA